MQTVTRTITETFRQARTKSVPLIAVNTTDPAATVCGLGTTLADDVVSLEWNISMGFRGLNALGAAWVQRNQPADKPPIRKPSDMLHMAAVAFERKTVLFVHNLNGLIALNNPDSKVYIQGIWNLRDPFAADFKTLVLLAPINKFPAELENDVYVIDEPLPTDTQLRAIIEDRIEECVNALAAFPVPTEEQMQTAVAALRGMNAFCAEQSIALCTFKDGLNIDGLWERKRERIRACTGIEVWAGNECYGDIGGYEAVKEFISRFCSGPAKPSVVVFIDEIEKAMAGSTGDTSGVSQEMHGALLQYMADRKAPGTLLLGHPGTAKSAVAKATGNQAGILTICFKLSDMKAGIVGESNQNLARALKVVDAVAGEGGRPYFIATCNSVRNLSPELLRRFKSGRFFFDLPDAAARDSIWNIYLEKYGLWADTTRTEVLDEGWTGAEIETCCELAHDLAISIIEASEYIVPTCRSDASAIEQRRSEATGRYLDACNKGTYAYADSVAAMAATPPPAVNHKRAVQF